MRGGIMDNLGNLEILECLEGSGGGFGLTGGEGIWQGGEAAEDASAGRRREETERA